MSGLDQDPEQSTDAQGVRVRAADAPSLNHAPAARSARSNVPRRLLSANESWTVLALVLIMGYFTASSPGKFLTTGDLSNIAANAAPILVMAVGQTFVILTAGIDLSVGSVLVLAGVVAGSTTSTSPGREPTPAGG